MSENALPKGTNPKDSRRNFIYTLAGAIIAAAAGWISGALPKPPAATEGGPPTPTADSSRISALEADVARLSQLLGQSAGIQPLAELEGEFQERVVFNKREMTVANPEGVLVNLVATNGHVGFRFYKDFTFGNETEDSPWSLFIEGVPGYQGLALLRDWRFTAALWDEDGKLLLGRLHPHPPANEPAKARLHVRGTVDEVQAMIEGSADQTSPVFQVVGGQADTLFVVDAGGNAIVGSGQNPGALILYDSENGVAHSLRVSGGQLTLSPL
jgi:hypothetical protein